MQQQLTVSGKKDPQDVAVKSYQISTRPTDQEFPYWLESESGEGMSMTEQDFFDALHQYFTSHF